MESTSRNIDYLIENDIAATSSIKSMLTLYTSSVSILHEISEKFKLDAPIYTVVEIMGPCHAPVFKMQAEYGGFNVTALGKTKRAAKRDAAKQLISKLMDFIWIKDLA